MASEDPHKTRLARFDITYFIAMAFAVLVIRDAWVAQSHVKMIPNSEFRGRIDQNAVTDLVIGPTTITERLDQGRDVLPKPIDDNATLRGAA